MTSGLSKGHPMKRRKDYKYESKEEALEARRKRRNRVRKERRHRARKHELTTSGEKTPQKTMRGGRQKKKETSTSEMAQSLSGRMKQRRHRCQAENSWIWQVLRATWQEQESAENSATQAATKEEKSSVPPAGEELVERSNG